MAPLGRPFCARHAATGEWVPAGGYGEAGRTWRRLPGIVGKLGRGASALQIDAIAPVSAAGAAGDRRWVVSAWVEGCTASQWLIHNGRFPPEVVLEVARQTAVGLAALEKSGLAHGDLGTQGLILRRGGEVAVVQPGLRAILRPEEGYAHAELPPEAYDYLAPERVTEGTPPNAASDLYACGCTWWQMLTGRPPLAGGTALAKLRSAADCRDSGSAAVCARRSAHVGGRDHGLHFPGAQRPAGVDGPARRIARPVDANGPARRWPAAWPVIVARGRTGCTPPI